MTGVAGTAETGCELVLSTDPDVAVVDLHLASEGGGDALIRRLAESASTTKVVVFTATTDPTELHGVLKAGADGIVLKEGGLPELLAGLDAVTRGEQYLSPSLRVATATPLRVGVADGGRVLHPAGDVVVADLEGDRGRLADARAAGRALGPALGQPEGADHEAFVPRRVRSSFVPHGSPRLNSSTRAAAASAARRPRCCP